MKEFLKIAFDRDNLQLLGYGANVRVNQPSYGAKLLVAGNDRTLNNFLQEYVGTVMNDLGRVMNINLRKTLSVYVLPSGNNTLCQYIAERDPLYRQNVFQFFSQMNAPVY